MFRFGTVFICLLLAGCASTGAVPRPFPRPGGSPHPPVAGSPEPPRAPKPVGTTGGGAGYAIAGTALGFRGVPYRNGGADPSGFDCSGFVWYVFAQHGVMVPRTVTQQFEEGASVDPGQLAPGDLVFFRVAGQSVSHVGMAIGGDEFVHAPSSRGEVRVERLGSTYWASRFAGAKRY
jgi:cell wall-associated NlpC family hydrolase